MLWILDYSHIAIILMTDWSSDRLDNLTNTTPNLNRDSLEIMDFKITFVLFIAFFALQVVHTIQKKVQNKIQNPKRSTNKPKKSSNR